MMQIIKKIHTHYIIALIVSMILSMAIWFGGPYLTIANQHPLQYIDKRIYIIMTIVFYFIQVYQNIVSCYRFYKNMFIIHNNILPNKTETN